MEISEEYLERIRQLRERQEMAAGFTSTLLRLRHGHQDMNPKQFKRWERYLVERDELALGAAVVMMDVRDGARHQSVERIQNAW